MSRSIRTQGGVRSFSRIVYGNRSAEFLVNSLILKRSSVARVWVLIAATFLASTAYPQQTRSESATGERTLAIPLKVIGGRLIAIGYVTGPKPERTKSVVSYEIALDKPETVIFNDAMYGPLVGSRESLEAGEGLFIDISF